VAVIQVAALIPRIEPIVAADSVAEVDDFV